MKNEQMNQALAQLLQSTVEEIRGNNLIQAKSHLSKVLILDKQQPDAIRLLGVIAALERNWIEALRLIDNSIRIDAGNGITHSNRGNVLMELKRYEEALKSYEEAIRLDPVYAEAYSNQGNALQALERYEEALKCYEVAIKLEPLYAEAYGNQGNALLALERYEEALKSYEEAIKMNAANASAFIGAARIFNMRKQYELALECSERALKIAPQYIEALLEKGRTFFQVKYYEHALAAYESALKVDVRCTKALMAMGHIHLEQKRFKDAQSAFKAAYEIDPDIDFVFGLYAQSTLQMCDWSQHQQLADDLINGVKAEKRMALPYNAFSLMDDAQLIKNAIEIYAKSVQGHVERERQQIKSEGKKIRLGYFSADFHNHPTAHLIAELFEKHDKSRFELIGFVFGRNQPDEMRHRLAQAFDRLIDVDEKTAKEIAVLARDMQIDIAIDLKGFTEEGRPRIFMHGAAPIQVSYLAFPGTMGLPCFDYIIADPILIPKDQQDAYVEKVIYMPNSYQVNDRNRKISENKKTKRELGLPDTGFIFCCFNNNYKITPAVFNGWLNILNAVEGSVLWLFGDNPAAIENLKIEFNKRGLSPERLIFAGRVEHADHLARYQLADLFLDTFPCNAHTTASDALWAGLPVLTLIGNSFASRVAASLLNAIGLPDLVTHTQEDYEQMAIGLAQDPKKLHMLKERLWKNRLSTPLFDTTLFAKNLETALVKVYSRNQEGLPPAHIEV